MTKRFPIIIVFIWICIQHCLAENQVSNILLLNKQTGLISNQVTSLEQDHYGYIWVGSTHGLNRIDGHEVITWELPQNTLQGTHITDLKADKANNCLWIFTKKGLIGCIDLSSFQLNPYPFKATDSLYIHHHQGNRYLWQYGPTKKCSRARLNKGELTTEHFVYEVTGIHTDEEGGEWLLTTHGLYLNGFKQKLPSSDSIKQVSTYRNICLAITPHEIIAYNHSRRISRRPSFPRNFHQAGECTTLATWEDKLLIFTPEKIFIYDILSGTFSTPQQGQIKNGRVLLQKNSVVYAYDGKGKLIRFGENGEIQSLQLMPTEIARQASHFIPDVITLNDSTEAISTYGNGLYLFDLKTGAYKHIRKGDLSTSISNNRINTLLADHTGCLWIGTEHSGLTCLQLSPNNTPNTQSHVPDARVTLITVDGEKQFIGTGEMSLSYTHNNVKWHFSCMTYDCMNHATYQYYLEGYDDTWQAATHNHTATYRELTPGRYTFHVRARINDTQWGTEGTHTIIIGEPWWTQWPAMLAVLVLFVLMALFLYLIIYRFIHPDIIDKNTISLPTPTTADKQEGPEESPINTSVLSAKDQRFKELLDNLLAEHIEDTNFTVEAFATSVGLKRTQFYTKVKQVTGMSPIELLRKAHLDYAAKLLIETDMNIDEIRERCGFSNSTTFYNYFKQQFGKTPRQYRISSPPTP